MIRLILYLIGLYFVLRLIFRLIVGTTIRTVNQQQAKKQDASNRNNTQNTKTDNIGEYVDYEEIK
jgi:hypothetical protein